MIAFFTMLWNYRKVTIPALIFVAFAGVMLLSHYRLKEGQKAEAARVVAEQQLEATQRVSAAKIDALQSTMEEGYERQYFLQKTETGIDQGRAVGDGPLAPVLRDTLGRLRQRQASRTMRH